MVITWQQLKDAREASGLTQAELAALVGVHPKTIVNWEATGVPRKSEYKVERALRIVHAEDATKLSNVLEQIRQNAASGHSSQELRDMLRSMSDWDLLNELLRRTRARSLQTEQPAGENAWNSNVVPSRDTEDLHSVDLREELGLAASEDDTAVDPSRGEA